MSILSKKISAISPVPASYALLGEQLGGLHSAILETIKPYFSERLTEGVTMVSAGQYSVLCKQVGDVSPCFVLGTAEHPVLAIIKLSNGVGQMISAQKLGAKVGGEEESRPLGLLDLVLIQSSVDEMLTALKGELGEGSSSVSLTKRCLSLSGVSGVDEGEKWVCVNLPIVPKDRKDEKTPVLCVDLLLSSFMADLFVAALGAGDQGLAIDPSDPWSSHMHTTVLQSTLPLKVIVEVINMSVADCTRLELGQTLTLPGASHRHLSVSTETNSGLISLATSTLGVSKSNKAVKLLDDVDPEFLSNIGTIMQA